MLLGSFSDQSDHNVFNMLILPKAELTVGQIKLKFGNRK